MEFRAIRTQQAYQTALNHLKEMASRVGNAASRDDFDVLSILVEAYEQKQERLAFPQPVYAPVAQGITLNTGREITLQSFWQEYVYEGTSGGPPSRIINERIIHHVLERAIKPVHLIRPIQMPISDNEDCPWFLGEPYTLPQISCVARFHSQPPARDPAMWASSLTIIWFQETFAFPIAPEILSQIQSINWNALAEDWDL